MAISILDRESPEQMLGRVFGSSIGQGVGSIAEQFAAEKLKQRTEAGYEKALKTLNLSPELKNLGPELLQSVLPNIIKQQQQNVNLGSLETTGLSKDAIKVLENTPEKFRVPVLKELFKQNERKAEEDWLNKARGTPQGQPTSLAQPGMAQEQTTSSPGSTQANVPGMNGALTTDALKGAPPGILKKYAQPLTAIENLEESKRHNLTVEEANKRAEEAKLDKDTREQMEPYLEQEINADDRIGTIDRMLALTEEDLRSGPIQQFMKKAGYEDLFLSPSSQEFRAAANQFILDLAKDMKGSLSDKDVTFLSNTFASLSQTPDGMRRILKAWKLKELYKRDYAREVQNLVEKEGSFKFNTAKRAYEAHKGKRDRIAGDIMKELGGKHSAPEIILDRKSVKTFDTEPDARNYPNKFLKIGDVWKVSVDGQWVDPGDLPKVVAPLS